MSKEAKIGLLLSLVIIVAIAIILKGVHCDSMNDLNEIQKLAKNNQSIQPENLPLNAVQNLSAKDSGTYHFAGLGNDGENLLPAPDRQTPAIAPEQVRPAGPIVYNSTTPQRDSAEDAVRLRIPLPGTSLQPENRSETDRIQPESGIYRHAVDAVIEAPDSSSIKAGQRNTIDVPPRVSSNTNANPPAGSTDRISPAPTRQSVRYTVVKGDDLSQIALKVYGDSEGKRWVNVKRIFEANTTTLEDMNNLKIGQILVIPSISGNNPVANQNRPAQTVTGISQEKTVPESKAETFYVVQKGDSLWSIAQNKLGGGNRFPEIAKLNDKMLSDEKSIRPGMKLKLPAR